MDEDALEVSSKILKEDDWKTFSMMPCRLAFLKADAKVPIFNTVLEPPTESILPERFRFVFVDD